MSTDDSLRIAKREYAGALVMENMKIMVSIEATAFELQDEFRQRRGERQEAERRRVAVEAAARFEKPKAVWCPLNLFARTTKGSLVVGWQLVNISRITKRRVYKYIPIQSSGVYDLRTLASLAKPFELDLVQEFEYRARAIRRDWQHLVTIRRGLRALTSDAFS